jgi:hypothetical protein
MPKEKAPVVGASDLCLCGTSKLAGAPRCAQCFTLNQVVTTHAVKLLADPKSAPWVRALLEQALTTKLEPPSEAG